MKSLTLIVLIGCVGICLAASLPASEARDKRSWRTAGRWAGRALNLVPLFDMFRRKERSLAQNYYDDDVDDMNNNDAVALPDDKEFADAFAAAFNKAYKK
ncbi:hypothetical protein CHUAL_013277 [Chamberlinius hualienensis]